MKSLNTLIRLQRRELNELRKQLGVLERQRNQLIEAITRLNEELQKEIEVAGDMIHMGNFFGNFSQRIRKRQHEIFQEIKKIDEQATIIREKILVVFGETKKYEIALENWKKIQRAEENRKETIQLDEIGIQQYQRMSHEEGI